jgi:hypothetical protein
VSCENHLKLNWVVGCSGLSKCFLVVNPQSYFVLEVVGNAIQECVHSRLIDLQQTRLQ